ncbi:MAG: hypothetical protein M1816_007235 [Peltula sp. TS41687]|nr:MAG: hypothetical protein M1816_007235 [Peltula sp. TS41687]
MADHESSSKFDEVHDRLERIEKAIQQLTDALVQNPALSGVTTLENVQRGPENATPVPAALTRSVDNLLSSSRQLQGGAGAFVADKNGDLQYVGPNSLSSITFEAGSIAQQTLKSKLPLLSGRSRTEASNVLKGLNRLKANASTILLEDTFTEPLEVGGKSWWLPDRDITFRLCTGKGMLVMDQTTKRLVSNSWLALRENTLFLGPKLANVQALMMSAVIVQQQSRPGLAWMLICQACRLAQTIGLHRRSDKARFRDESEYEERKWVFWNLYTLDKTLSMAFGRTVCMPDFDIDVDLPKQTEEIEWPLLMAWIWLSKIQSRIYERLYSATAYASGDEQRHSAALELDAQLRSWSMKHMQTLLESRTAFFGGQYLELELKFNYYNSLVMIHRVDYSGGPESEKICLDSAREAIEMVRTAFTQHSELADSDIALWNRRLYLYYPFTPFFTLITHVLRNTHLPTTQHDLDLIRHVRDHLGKMKHASVGAARLWRVAHLFTRMVETLVEEYVQDPEQTKKLGKRKRNYARGQEETQPNTGIPFSTSFKDLPDNATDMQFLRSIHQPQAAFQPEALEPSNDAELSEPTTEQRPKIDPPPPPTTNEFVHFPPLLNSSLINSTNDVPDHMLTAAAAVADAGAGQPGTGILDFDWILWDQSLDPNFVFGLGLDLSNLGNDGESASDFTGSL